MNATEELVKSRLESEGWEVLRTGWPDFLAVNDKGEVKLVEVKANHDRVRFDQQRMHDVLKSVGLKVEVIQFGVASQPPSIKLPKGYCPFCNEIVHVRKTGIPYQHAPNVDRQICEKEPYDFENDAYIDISEIGKVTRFIEDV